MGLQVKGQLLVGISRILLRKTRYVLSDVNDTLQKIKLATEEHFADSEEELDIGKLSLKEGKKDEGIKIRFDIRDVEQLQRKKPKQHAHDINLPPEPPSPEMLRAMDLDDDRMRAEQMFRDDPEAAERSMALSNSMLKSILDGLAPTLSRKPADDTADLMLDNDVTMRNDPVPEIDISIRTPREFDSTIIQGRADEVLDNTELRMGRRIQEILYDVMGRDMQGKVVPRRRARKGRALPIEDDPIELESSDLLVSSTDVENALGLLVMPPRDRRGLLDSFLRSMEHLVVVGTMGNCSRQLVEIMEKNRFAHLLKRVKSMNSPGIHRGSGHKRSSDKAHSDHMLGLSKRPRSGNEMGQAEMAVHQSCGLERSSANVQFRENELPSMDDVIAGGGSFALHPRQAPGAVGFPTDLTINQSEPLYGNKTNVLSSILHSVTTNDTTCFETICQQANASRRNVARSFAHLLELRKAKAVQLYQKESYGPIEIAAGDSFNETFKSISHTKSVQ